MVMIVMARYFHWAKVGMWLYSVKSYIISILENYLYYITSKIFVLFRTLNKH